MKRHLQTSGELLARYQRIARVWSATPWLNTQRRCECRLSMIRTQIDHAVEYERGRKARADYGRVPVEIGAFSAVEKPQYPFFKYFPE